MNKQPWQDNDRLAELLAARAIEGLSQEEEAEIERLLDELGANVDAEVLNRTVASLDVAIAETEDEPMPAELRRSIENAAAGWPEPGADTGAEPRTDAAIPPVRLVGDGPLPATRAPSTAPAWLGWVAAAACLVIAAVAWWPSSGTATGAPSLSEQLASLRARPGVVTASWAGLDDLGFSADPHRYDQSLAGEVVWDAESQQGFMVFTGLASNDATEFQYQLWIFDAERRLGDLPQFAVEGLPILTQRPVDGGVFDGGESGEIIIPIDAKLPVGQAALFAITVEPPGGVVVSDRDIVVAALPG